MKSIMVYDIEFEKINEVAEKLDISPAEVIEQLVDMAIDDVE